MRRPALLALLVFLAVCRTNPTTGRSQFRLFSEEEMISLGVQAYQEMTVSDPEVRINTSPGLNAPLQRVGEAISTAANKPEYEWEFKLIDDVNTVNAWALPGGKIAFYTGIYPILDDEAGMSIVMGHEVMHALLDHGNERMSQNLATTAVLTAAAIGLHDSENGGLILGALGVGATVGVLLPYSRKHETEADEYGLYLAARSGYDPNAGIAVWERMNALGGERPPEFLSTHPATENRIANMRRWMPKAAQLYNEAPHRPNSKLPR